MMKWEIFDGLLQIGAGLAACILLIRAALYGNDKKK